MCSFIDLTRFLPAVTRSTSYDYNLVAPDHFQAEGTHDIRIFMVLLERSREFPWELPPPEDGLR